MIRFIKKQKMFLLPALGAASGLAKTLGVINVGAGVVGAGTGIAGMVQSSSQAADQEKMQRKQMIMDQANNDKLAESLNKLADASKNNPMLANQAGQLVGQSKAYSGDDSDEVKLFGIAEFAKDGIKGMFEYVDPLTEAKDMLTLKKGDHFGNAMKVGGTAFATYGAVAGTKALIDGKKQGKEMKAEMENQMMEKQRAADNLVNQINSLTASAKAYSSNDEDFKLFTNDIDSSNQRSFSIIQKLGTSFKRAGTSLKESKALRNTKDLAKAVGGYVNDNKGVLIGGLAVGAGMAGYDYIGNKVIQANMKHNGIDMQAINEYQKDLKEQEANNPQYYDDPRYYSSKDEKDESKKPTVKLEEDGWINPNNPHFNGSFGKKAWKYGAHYAKEAALGGALFGIGGGIGKYIGYSQQKDALKELSDEALRYKAEKEKLAQKQYSLFGFKFKNIPSYIGKGVDFITKGKNSIKAHPVKSTLNTASKLGMGGGKDGINNFANKLMKNDNESVKKVGKFIKKHPLPSLAGSVAVGAGLTKVTWDAGTAGFEKAAKKLDPKAYAYDDYQNQEIE